MESDFRSAIILTREKRQPESKKPAFDFPAYNVNCKIVSDAEDERFGQVASIGYLGLEHRNAALSMRAHHTPDQLVFFVELPPEEDGSDLGETQFRVTVGIAHFHVVNGFLCAETGNERKPVVLHNTPTTNVNVDDGATYSALLKRIAKRNKSLNRTLSEDQRAIFLRTINGLGLGDDSGPNAETSKQVKAPYTLPQPTFYEARTGATAISDGRDLRDWGMIEGMAAMLHAPKDSIMQTRFEPCSMLLGWWGKPTGAELETLKCELQNLEFDALVTYFVCLSWAIEDYQVTTSLDSIIEAIGRGTDARRSTKKRQELRAKVWRWMLLFDSLAVIGARRGTWREPRDGDKKREKIDPDKLYSRDALLRIIGTRATEQGTFDNSAPPKEVSFVAGAWVNQFRGNREMLSDFGNVRAIASIPRGKPSGAWAACVGFALNQKWREQASYAPVSRISKGDKKAITQKFRPFTRRVLLAQLWRSDVDPEEILKGSDPSRAKEYWDAAIEILREEDVIGIYQEIKPLTVTGYGWQDAWLDQPLDIRPTGDTRKDAITIHKAATEAKKRTRKKPPKTPKTD